MEYESMSRKADYSLRLWYVSSSTHSNNKKQWLFCNNIMSWAVSKLSIIVIACFSYTIYPFFLQTIVQKEVQLGSKLQKNGSLVTCKQENGHLKLFSSSTIDCLTEMETAHGKKGVYISHVRFAQNINISSPLPCQLRDVTCRITIYILIYSRRNLKSYSTDVRNVTHYTFKQSRRCNNRYTQVN